MSKHFFDYDDGDFAYAVSDNMAIDSDGNMMMRMGDNMAMDMDSGELHINRCFSRTAKSVILERKNARFYQKF